ncbi:uncharacterized protein LOC105779016 [Gossypium raimondii]|uniref:uncharacterized protein LOC105779016 n=1 Tax=Gossypium raimondii TaxID=29730 RepID=UPI00063AB626|nr:uncharacterized protein LOC105779016 [Gossypium raimondii]
MSPTSLIIILTENKLNGDNFREWKQNLLIVLNCEKHKFVLDETCPIEAQPKVRNRWRGSDSIVRCYMLASMSSVLEKQHENFRTAMKIRKILEDLLGGQVKPDTPVKEHMLKLMGLFAEVEDNGAELDVNTQIEIVFKSLTNEFASFKDAYNLGNKTFTLTQLMKELQFYELMLNGGKLIQEKPEANLAMGPSSSKGK